MFKVFSKLFDANAKELKRLDDIVAEVNSLEKKAKRLKPSDFPKQTEKLKTEINGKSENLEKALPWAYAIVREAAFRVLGERHYDVPHSAFRLPHFTKRHIGEFRNPHFTPLIRR